MEKDPIITVKNIGKRFVLGGQGGGYLSIRDRIQNMLSAKKVKKEPFWALKDVNFDVFENDRLAIIGRNGAGKSTLLKIISRITPPTTGEITIKGRVASLLEVGTGFHAELSGRENVFLNGSILGLRRQEIRDKFDEIIEFAGVAKFIDTPLRHYSSGMQLRLAFAVAAHLDPEILIIDEVLAVGDTDFQKKCIGKMKDIADSGRTLLFVSHNMAAIRSLCNRAMLLSGGTKEAEGEVPDILELYSRESRLKGTKISLRDVERTESKKDFKQEIVFDAIEFEDAQLQSGSPISFRVKMHREDPSQELEAVQISAKFVNKDNLGIIHLSNHFLGIQTSHKDDSVWYHFKCENNLAPGIYYLTLYCRSSANYQDWLREAIQIEVLDSNPYDFSDTAAIAGVVFPKFEFWEELPD